MIAGVICLRADQYRPVERSWVGPEGRQKQTGEASAGEEKRADSYERRFVKRELQKSTEKVENQPKMIGKAALVLLLFAF